MLYDRETGTLWYPYRNGLMGIQGKYFKKWLPKLPSEDTTWERWRKRHPSSELLN
ncbi:MAG: DUF3179 domain-containing protein [Deltaproteobacteria bacterium]|nr:DUF3179 domain-containing protein [Deltaproteobacteria bacterium]